MSVREGLVYAVHDGVDLRGDLYQPEGKGPHPVLVAAPGGAWLRGDRTGLQGWGDYLSRHGVAVFSIDYRRSTTGAVFPQNARDVAAAARFIQADADNLGLDRERMGLLGASAGAHLAALTALAGETPLIAGGYPDDLGADAPLRLRVLVTVYGVFDLAAHWVADSQKPMGPEGDLTERMLGASPDAAPQLYRLASPVTYVAQAPQRPHVLVVWGDKDDAVLPEQSIAFARALADANFPTQTLVAEGAGHFWFSKDAIDQPFNAYVAPRLVDFLQKHLVGAV